MRASASIDLRLDAARPAAAEERTPYDRYPRRWLWAASLFLGAVLLQVALHVLTLLPALGGGATGAVRWLTFALSLGLLAMVVVAIHGFGRDRRESWRRSKPVSYWTFAAGLALQAFHVGSLVLGLQHADPTAAAPIPLLGRSVDPVLLRADVNLAVLVAMVLGFVGLGGHRDHEAARREREQIRNAQSAEALGYLARAERLYGDVHTARELMEEAVALALDSNEYATKARALLDLANLELTVDRPHEAAEQLAILLDLAVHRGDCEEHRGPVERWRHALGEEISSDTIVQCVRAAALEALRVDDRERASMLYGMLDVVREAAGVERGEVQDLIVTLDPRRDARMREASEKGRRMGPAAAMRYVAAAPHKRAR